MRINVNHRVKVRLTEQGRRMFWWPHEQPKEDSDGWSEWQLRTLMATFGKHIHEGRELPFDPVVDIILEFPEVT